MRFRRGMNNCKGETFKTPMSTNTMEGEAIGVKMPSQTIVIVPSQTIAIKAVSNICH